MLKLHKVRNKAGKPLALIALPALISFSAHASYGVDQARLDKVDTSKWRCKFCPTEEGLSGSVEGQIAYSSEDSSPRLKQQGAQGDEIQAALNINLRSRDEQGQTDYRADGLGSHQVSANAEHKNNGAFIAGLVYEKNTDYGVDQGTSVFTSPSDNLTLTNTWVDQNSTSAMNFSNLTPILPQQQRSAVETYAENKFGESAIALSIHFRQQTRLGLAWSQGSILNDIVALPRQTNDQHNELTLSAAIPFSVSDGQGRYGLEYFTSIYDNNLQSLNWENPFIASVTGADNGQLASAPDSEFSSWRWFANAFWGTHRLDLSYREGKGEQDQAFLPYTLNGNLITTALPVQSLDGEVKTRSADIKWNTSLSAHWNLKTQYRFNERDNLSPSLLFTPVMTDSLILGSQRNPRYSHKKTDLDISLDWRLRSQTRFEYAYQYERFKREREAVGEYAAHGLSLAWHQRWDGNLKTRTKLAAQERSETDRQAISGSSPLYRDYSVADRLRNSASLDADWQFSSDLILSANTAYHHDDYEDTLVGLTETEETHLGVNAQWQINKHLTTHAGIQRQWLSWQMSGSSQLSYPTWHSVQDDTSDVFSLGFRRSGLNDGTVTLGANYTYLKSEADTQLRFSDPYLAEQINGHNLFTYLNYQWRPEWTLKLEALYERYEREHSQALALNSLSRLIAKGAEDENDSNWMFGLRLRYDIPVRMP